MTYKYCLIVSQYWHSRHMFIVKIDENFIEKARKCTKELEDYKRDKDHSKGYNLGDLDHEYCGKGINPRYNVNDAGDIYFINSPYANYCMSEAFEYQRDTIRDSRGYKRKEVIQSISEHHNHEKIKEIIKKYFEIA